jgi:transcriptional regulator with XRE-family HTH domain
MMTTLIRDARHRRAVGVRELARRCGVTAPTVVDWERSEAAGAIQVGTLYRALAAMGERLAVRSRAETIEFDPLERREQRLGLELHRSIAIKLVADPELVLESARQRLGSMRPSLRGGALAWLDQWEQLIEDRDVGGLIVVMLGTTQHDIDMRSVSPFTGLLSPEEREEVLARASATAS